MYCYQLQCTANADCCSRNCLTSRCLTSISNDIRPSSQNNVEIPNRFSNCQAFGNNVSQKYAKVLLLLLKTKKYYSTHTQKCNVGRDCCSGECTRFKCIAKITNTSSEKPQIGNRNDAPQQKNCQTVNQRVSISQ